ncbi:hypothetical protein NPX13_g6183 [Xylaria arbuscula]|uniref:Uncharacterized protein n=1 Tax=Xylaria arbuscula TaxID=114810 RepID=A0A9W8TKC7_9PEZI|nr:hypothetical protein NPX13_g6183 [Xylaria arbuscula]
MATSWPQQTAWPTEVREHATHLSKYLQDALRCVEQAQDQPIPANLVKSMILGMASLVAKVINMADVRSISETLNIIQTQVKIEANITALTLYEIKDDMERTATKLRSSTRDSSSEDRFFSARVIRQRKPTEAMLPLSSDSTSHDVR